MKKYLLWIAALTLAVMMATAGCSTDPAADPDTPQQQADLMLIIGGERVEEIPGEGESTEGVGWRLSNEAGAYTLTLENAQINDLLLETMEYYPPLVVRGNLNLELVGDNTLTAIERGIDIVNGVITVSGDGSLTINSDKVGINQSTIGETCQLNIESGQITIKSKQIGIAISMLTLSGGSLTVSDGIFGLWGTANDFLPLLTVSGGELRASGSEGGIYCERVAITGGTIETEGAADTGFGLNCSQLTVDLGSGSLTARGGNSALIVAQPTPDVPQLVIGANTAVVDENYTLQQADATYSFTQENETIYQDYQALLYADEDGVAFDEDTTIFINVAKEITFQYQPAAASSDAPQPGGGQSSDQPVDADDKVPVQE